MRSPLIYCFLFETRMFFLDKLPEGEYNIKKQIWVTGGQSAVALGDRKCMLAGRMSDKVSSALGYYLIITGRFYYFRRFLLK